VEAAVERRGADVRIAIQDHGIGIPAGDRALIFSKFKRGEQARKRGIKGTGIGLAIVDEIVEAHRGRMEVESELERGSGRSGSALPDRWCDHEPMMLSADETCDIGKKTGSPVSPNHKNRRYPKFSIKPASAPHQDADRTSDR
jgi:hypothetical protein